jgi:beta-mannosidase
MACAIYPQDPAFQEQLRQEAEAVVRRLRGHPSLVLWAGDNECDQKHVRTGSGRDPDRNILTRSVIPEVLRMEDPTRPYLPSSPYIDHVAAAAGERFLPEDHLWGPRDDFKGDYYRGALCHFVSEIGYLGAPDVASLRQFLSPGAVWPYADNAEWLLHATSPLPGIDVHDYRVELLATQIRSLFGSVPDTLEGFVNASQATQAEALKFFIETFRAGKWRRTGIIWWNLADGWPQFSDAVVDYFGRKKRAFDVVRRSQLPVIAVVREPHDGFHEVVVCNDDRDAAVTSVVVRDADTDAILLAATATATGDSVTPIGRIPAEAEHRFLILDSVANGVPTRSHYLAGAPPFSLGRYLKWMASAVR